MIPRLDEDGRLIPPHTRAEGVEHIRQLRHEAAKIDKQLNTPTTRYKTIEDALRWRYAASRKLNLFRAEEIQLSAWLAGYKAATDEGDKLLGRAHALLSDLELQLDFDREQQELMADLDDHCLPEVDKEALQ